ncbi:MAG: heavy-metal-associated domain-containing protein [Phycisphaerae bacterium]
MKRSVERVDGVRQVSMDLQSGRANVQFQPDKMPDPADLWDAVRAGGFTPVRVQMPAGIYEGPDTGEPSQDKTRSARE